MRHAHRSGDSGSEHHVHGAGAAIYGARGNERHDVHVTAQPEVHGDLEHGASSARTIALAVDDPHAAQPTVAAVCKKVRELVARGRLSEPVKVQLIVDGIEAAAQAPHDLDTHA